MAQLARISWLRYVLFPMLGFLAVFVGLKQLSQAQFNDDRRRTDFSPVTLPGGATVEFKSFDSQTLGAPERYSIFLPPSFSREPSRTYPVIYFLHGLNNDETSWTVNRYGNIQDSLDQLMISKKIPEFIMVHPRGDSSFYCNYVDGSKRYEDLVTQELVAYMEANYRAAKGREDPGRCRREGANVRSSECRIGCRSD